MDSLFSPQVWLDERHRVHLALQAVLLGHPKRQQHRKKFIIKNKADDRETGREHLFILIVKGSVNSFKVMLVVGSNAIKLS